MRMITYQRKRTYSMILLIGAIRRKWLANICEMNVGQHPTADGPGVCELDGPIPVQIALTY